MITGFLQRLPFRLAPRTLYVLLSALLLVACTGSIEDATSHGRAGGPGIVRVSSCPVGQQACDGRCVNVTSDPQACGACGVVCGAGELCESGTCQAFCAVGELTCGAECVATASDLRHCGECGRECAAGQFCNAGTCSAECDYEVCEVDGRLECADLSSNPNHCGACGAACAAGRSCAAGKCELVCPEGRTNCGDRCVDVLSDAQNCGSCGETCAADEPCIQGACGCPDGQTLCDGACVDLTSSNEHCGECGKSCSGGSACSAGQCVCSGDEELCDGACVDTQTEPQRCGSCTTKCSDDELCEQGACKPKSQGCSSGLSLCGASCVDTLVSSSHCGGCDEPCPAAQSCAGGSCVCPSGGQLCEGSCVNTNTSNTHCGVCNVACTGGRTCDAGSCVCDAGQLYCGSTCIDPQTSNSHCGGCNQPCPSGQTCVAGACSCPSGQRACSGLCVDTQTSDEHCGGCGIACSGGRSCVAGNCQCPSGQTLCGGTCVDTRTDSRHCGGCNAPCSAGQTCSAGTCGGGGGIGADGCSGLARNLTLSQVAVYQSVKIPVMNAMAAVAPASRVADVVAGRDSLFRVFSTLGSGFAARELSARVTVVNGATSDTYFQKKTLSASSSDADPSTTFQVSVPRDKIRTGTRYFVEVVECGASSGSTVSPRFPVSGDAELGARTTGPLKVRLIPIQANSRLPSTTDASVAVYRDYLDAMYPVSNVQIDVGTQITTEYPINWSNVLDQLRTKRQSDAPAADVYYYGLLAPTATFQEFCGSACTTGIGYVSGASQSSQRAAVGIGFADQNSAMTMAHELGHNHGRNHAPCSSGSISGVDASYPHEGGLLGVWGYDKRSQSLLDPTRTTDIMGYCRSKWISDYTYRAITARVVTVNGAADQFVALEALQRWRVLLLDSAGPRWGLPITQPSLPEGEPEIAEILDQSGALVAQIEVYRTDIPDIGAAMVQVPEPRADWHAVRVSGGPAHPFAAPITVPRP